MAAFSPQAPASAREVPSQNLPPSVRGTPRPLPPIVLAPASHSAHASQGQVCRLRREETRERGRQGVGREARRSNGWGPEREMRESHSASSWCAGRAWPLTQRPSATRMYLRAHDRPLLSRARRHGKGGETPPLLQLLLRSPPTLREIVGKTASGGVAWEARAWARG
jgi:hypothetical protein